MFHLSRQLNVLRRICCTSLTVVPVATSNAIYDAKRHMHCTAKACFTFSQIQVCMKTRLKRLGLVAWVVLTATNRFACFTRVLVLQMLNCCQYSATAAAAVSHQSIRSCHFHASIHTPIPKSRTPQLLGQNQAYACRVDPSSNVGCDVVVAEVGPREDAVLAECEHAVVLEQTHGLGKGVHHEGGLDCSSNQAAEPHKEVKGLSANVTGWQLCCV